MTITLKIEQNTRHARSPTEKPDNQPQLNSTNFIDFMENLAMKEKNNSKGPHSILLLNLKLTLTQSNPQIQIHTLSIS